jgi:phosphoribosylformylglycinamidine synthase
VGKAIRFDVDASDEAAARTEIDELCRRLLANPVIEEADVSISAGGRAG